MTHSIAHEAQTSVVDASVGLVARLRKVWADYRLYSATVVELQQLSDRELADLGFHRALITDIARESVYRA